MHLFLVGAGHVGLVTALGFARLGHRVTVADIDAARIDGLRAGRPPIFEPGLEEGLAACAAEGLVDYTTELDLPPDAAISIVCVNTPTGPDGPLATHNVEAVVARLLDAGPDHTVVVRSTLPLDGPDRLLAVADGRADRPALVTNPEFMREGAALVDFERPSRVVTGWIEPRDRPAAERVAALYAPLEAPTMIADARSVALIKVASNVFLAAKVAYANELARLCDAIGADIETVVDGIGADARIGRQFLNPGPGVGGSCLPEQSVALAAEAAARGVPAPLIAAVSRSNDQHQRAIVGRLARSLGDGRLDGCRIALLGLAFKADTDDVRASPGLRLAAEVRAAGGRVVGYDPRAGGRARAADRELEVADDALTAARGADAVLLATEWREFRTLDWRAIGEVMRGRLVLDTRAVADPEAVRSAGLEYACLGRPDR